MRPFLPLADVRPGCRHVVVDLCDLVCVVVGVQGQQFVSKGVGLIHLTLPLLQLLQKALKGEEVVDGVGSPPSNP